MEKMSETVMSESQRTRCRNIMVGHAESLICGHSDEIMDTLNEMFESSPDDKASLDIPIVLRVKRDVDAGYTFGGKIDIRKVEHVKDSVDDITYNPNLPDLPGFEDGKVPQKKKADKAEVISGDQLKCLWAAANEAKIDELDIKTGVKEYWNVEHVHDIPATKFQEVMDWIKDGCKKIEKAKPGDNGNVFVFKDGSKAPVFDYEDVKEEKIAPVNKEALTAKSLLDYKLPETPFRLIRGKAKDGKTVTYYIDLLPATEAAPKPEEAPANAPEEKKSKGRQKKAEAASAPEKQSEEKKPEEKKADVQTQAQNISLFLAKHNLSVAEVETLLRQEKRLGISTSLQTNQNVQQYVFDNIEGIKEALTKTE